MNLVYIVVDALRRDRLSCYGYSKETSPHIDNLARKGVRFNNAFTNGGFTDPGFTTLITGMMSIKHKVICRGVGEDLPQDILTVAEILKSNKYRTVAIDNLYDQHYSMRTSPREWFKRGYDYYSSSKGPYSIAEERTEKAIKWLRRNYQQKFFMFIHYWDTHAPYIPPAPYDTVFYQGDKYNPRNHSLDNIRIGQMSGIKKYQKVTDVNYVISQYDGEVAYVDNYIGTLIDTIEKLGLEKNTLIVLTSDHGENLAERGFFGHAMLYEETLRIPLIFVLPGKIPAGKVIDADIQYSSLPPTILDILRMEIPRQMESPNLVPQIFEKSGRKENELYFAECSLTHWPTKTSKCVRTPEWKYIKTYLKDEANPSDFKTKEELFNLKEDILEKNNLIKSKRNIATGLSKGLDNWVEKSIEGSRIGDPFMKLLRGERLDS